MPAKSLSDHVIVDLNHPNGYLKKMKFILFDIDGTLMDSGGGGVRSLNLAFEEMFSVSRCLPLDKYGRQDRHADTQGGFELHGISCSTA